MALGIDAVKNNNQKKAVYHLLPLAKGGNKEAMYYLGALFIEAKNVSKHKAIAEKFLTKASAGGHVKASQLLQQLQFSNAAGNPSPDKIKIVNKYLPTKDQARQIKKAERRINASRVKAPKTALQVEIFVSGVGDTLDRIISDADYIKRKYPGKVSFSYYIKIGKVSPYNTISSEKKTNKIPDEGFSPDVNGTYTKKSGVSLLPAVVLTRESGKKIKITPSDLRRDLLKALNSNRKSG
jgi:hypothetical protein